jgi:serine/threonine protein phosphatase PrpC
MTRDNFQIDSAAVSDRGLSKKRPQNEDSFLQLAERGVFAVADGVGGAQAGDVASQMAMEILAEAFNNSRANSDAEDVMKMAIQHANASIFQMSNDLPQLSTMATTIVALHLDGNIATIGHVGDSRLYRLDGRGSLYRETQDHSVVEEEVRAGRMTPAQAATHPSRNVISRALGAEQTVEIDMKTIMFEPNTSFLLCSDGITRHIEDFEIRELLQTGENPSIICERMKSICYERGAEDNLTAVIVRVGEAPAQVPSTAAQPNLEADFEEATIAASRLQQPIVSNASIVHSNPEDGDIPTQSLDASILGRNEINKSSSAAEPAHEYAKTQEAIPPASAETSEQVAHQKIPAVAPEIKREVVTVESARNTGNGILGKILSSIILLAVGTILGAGLHYYWTSQNQTEAPPQMPPMQTSDITLTSFEKNRRNVDRDPAQFIETNKIAPADAEGFYLLGRAHLLTGNLTEARNNFLEAKNRLGQTGETNRKVLANEIAMGLAIINVPLAQPEFKKESSSENSNVNSQNTNVNLTNVNANTQ